MAPDRLPGKALAVVAVVLVAAATFVAALGGTETRSVTAHFSRAVSIYEGTEMRVLGVTVGEVTAVIPEGDSVRVEMEYDAQYALPADAQAVIITPTLVADRFVQITPVWREGDRKLADGADIALPETASPVELDRIYSSLDELSTALGPNGANRNGSLDTLLAASAKALDGQGATANRMILDMSQAAETFGNHSGELFATVRNLDAFTTTLARNDRTVDRFITRLARVSDTLATERQELSRALESLASALGKVQTFVRDNRDQLTGNVEDLTSVLDVLVKEQDDLITALEKGPLGASNLALAFDNETGSIGSRVQFGPNAEDLDGFLCSLVQNSDVRAADQVCRVLKELYDPIGGGLAGGDLPDLGARAPAPDGERNGSREPASDLDELLGGRG